jgi:hypothetical protein
MVGEKSRFTSDRRLPKGSSWAGESDWAAGVAENVDVVDGQLVGRSPNQHTESLDSTISQEEGGNLFEYAGDTGFYNVTTSPVVGGSEYAIQFGNDSTTKYIEAPFVGEQYRRYSLYVHPQNEYNNVVVFGDSINGNAVFAIYFREFNNTGPDAGIYYTGADGEVGSVTNAGSDNRSNGTQLLSEANTDAQYHHIELVNIDWMNETVDVALDGSIIVTGAPFNLPGVPDFIQFTSNSGSGDNIGTGYVDKIGFEP